MKKTIFGVLIFAVLFAACKKEETEESSPPTKEELLCQTWNINTFTHNGFGFAWLPRLYQWKFKTDGSIEWYEIETGNYKRSSKWSWAENQQALDIELERTKGPTKELINARVKIVKLTSSEMIWEPGDSEEQIEMTFSR